MWQAIATFVLGIILVTAGAVILANAVGSPEIAPVFSFMFGFPVGFVAYRVYEGS